MISGDIEPASLTWRTTRVSGRQAQYGVAGRGAPLIFLHGWGLAPRVYARGLELLAARGFRVHAPALPGFGGTAELPGGDPDLGDFAWWVTEFAETVGIGEPVTLVGHSFGGGAAIRTAHDAPKFARRLVLVNSLGGALGDRPLWDWGFQLQADLLPLHTAGRLLPLILRDAVPNLLRNPFGLWRSGNLARATDLTAELGALRRRGLDVSVVWGEDDAVLPPAALDSITAALGDPRLVRVRGKHNWPFGEPDRFGEVLGAVLAESEKDGQPERSSARTVA